MSGPPCGRVACGGGRAGERTAQYAYAVSNLAVVEAEYALDTHL